MNISLLIPAQATFGENVWSRSGPGFQRKRDHFLGVTHSVNSGGVDPINTKLERAVNRGDRCFVILLAPTKFPARTTYGPGAKADGGYGEIGVTELLRLHINPSEFHFRSFLSVPVEILLLVRPRTCLVIQLALVSGPTSWKWTPLWAPTSIAPCLSQKMPSAVFSLSNFALLNDSLLVTIRKTAACQAIDFRLRLGAVRFDTSPGRHASPDRKCRRLDRCNNRVG